MELDPRNLVTLCINKTNQHHLLLGHLDDFESYNPAVRHFIAAFRGKTGAEIRAAKPKHLDAMTPEEIVAFKKMLDRKLPVNPAIVAKAKKARR